MTDDPLQLPSEVGAFSLSTPGPPALYYRDYIPVEKLGFIFLHQPYFLHPPQLLSLYPSSFLRAFLEKPRLQCINITAAATGPAPCRRRHRIPHRARPVTVSLTNRTISFFAGRQRKNFARWSSRAQVAGSLPHCPSFASSSGYSDGGDAGPEDLCLPKHCYKTFPTFIVKGSCH